jgi:regulator of RNase E activity RraA
MDVEKIKNLVEFDTPTVANGLSLLGVRDDSYGYTGPDIRALTPEFGARVGIAVTARMDTTSPGVEECDNLYKEWLQGMLDIARGAGNLPVFAVIESVGLRPRYTVTIGDGMGTQMRMAGAAGFITNGSVRDIEGLRGVPLACWGAGLSPQHGQMRWLDVHTTVVIDGMTVKPGDLIHADENGAVAIPAQVADQVCDKARAVRDRERDIFAGWTDKTIEEILRE